jgi:HEAT repeat protein
MQAARARQAEAVRKLGAADAETVRAGIEALREIGGSTAERELITRAQSGLPPALTLAALDALVALKSRRAVPTMLELAQHRRALVRSHALSALGAIERRGARAAQSQMLSALEDESTEVSTAAAKALVLIGTRSALPALFTAYDRGLAAALATIGELAGRESVETLLERAPAGKIETVEPALNRLLERKALSAVDQVKLAQRLAELGTPSARRYLLEWLDRIKLDGSARVKRELFESLKKLESSQGASRLDPVVATKEAAR